MENESKEENKTEYDAAYNSPLHKQHWQRTSPKIHPEWYDDKTPINAWSSKSDNAGYDYLKKIDSAKNLQMTSDMGNSLAMGGAKTLIFKDKSPAKGVLYRSTSDFYQDNTGGKEMQKNFLNNIGDGIKNKFGKYFK